MSTEAHSDEASVVRSVERAHVRRERFPVERLRVVRTVETEVRTIEVPVRVERLRVERVPLDGGDAAAASDRGGVGDRDLEVVLHEEVPVVSTQVRPYERVHVRVREVVEEQAIDVRLREEQVVAEVKRT